MLKWWHSYTKTVTLWVEDIHRHGDTIPVLVHRHGDTIPVLVHRHGDTIPVLRVTLRLSYTRFRFIFRSHFDFYDNFGKYRPVFIIFDGRATFRCLSLLDVGIWGRLPQANWVCNGQPQPSVTGPLLFPVQTFGTAYQPTCVFRHQWWALVAKSS